MPPAAPALHSPAHEASGLSNIVTLSWGLRVHTASYTLQISTTAGFPDLFIHHTGLTDTCHTVSCFAPSTDYYWRICAVNAAGNGDFSDIRHFTTSAFTSVDPGTHPLPKCYALLPACPNPFNPETAITCLLPENAEISLVIYNGMGQIVRELASGFRPAGQHTVTWDGWDNRGNPVTSGLYICHFQTGCRISPNGQPAAVTVHPARGESADHANLPEKTAHPTE